jgi:CHASE3 domain sensor protein
MGLIASASITGNNTIGRHLSEVTRTQQLVSELNGLLILVTDMETGERGFVITGDSTFLAPYENAKSKIDAQLVQFYSLIRVELHLKIASIGVGTARPCGST